MIQLVDKLCKMLSILSFLFSYPQFRVLSSIPRLIPYFTFFPLFRVLSSIPSFRSAIPDPRFIIAPKWKHLVRWRFELQYAMIFRFYLKIIAKPFHKMLFYSSAGNGYKYLLTSWYKFFVLWTKHFGLFTKGKKCVCTVA